MMECRISDPLPYIGLAWLIPVVFLNYDSRQWLRMEGSVFPPLRAFLILIIAHFAREQVFVTFYTRLVLFLCSLAYWHSSRGGHNVITIKPYSFYTKANHVCRSSLIFAIVMLPNEKSPSVIHHDCY